MAEPKTENGRYFQDIPRLAQDMGLLATMPEVYDVHFIVGKEKEFVGGVKAILAVRSRVFYNMLFAGQGVRGRDLNTQKKTSRKQRSFAFLKRDSQSKIENKTQTNQCMSIAIEDFEVDEFARLMEFIHCGRCVLDARCIMGILAAADFFAVDDLQMAAFSFIDKCISVDNVCHFFCDAEKYIQLKSIKSLIPKLLEFTATHARVVLGRAPFRSLPQHVARLILARKDLDATEWEKFIAVISWAHAYCDKHDEIDLKEAVEPLIDCIAFYKIPTMQLMQEVRQLHIVPDKVLMKALAYQADPLSVEETKPTTPRKKIPYSSSQSCLDAKSSVEHRDEASDVKLDRLTKG